MSSTGCRHLFVYLRSLTSVLNSELEESESPTSRVSLIRQGRAAKPGGGGGAPAQPCHLLPIFVSASLYNPIHAPTLVHEPHLCQTTTPFSVSAMPASARTTASLAEA